MGRWECRYLRSPERVSGFGNYSDRQLRAAWHGYWEPHSTPLQEQQKLLIPEHFSGHARLFSTQKSGLLVGDDVISSSGEAKQKSSRSLLGLIWSCDLFTPLHILAFMVDLHSSAQRFPVLLLHYIPCHSGRNTHSDLHSSGSLALSASPVSLGCWPLISPVLAHTSVFRWGFS